MNTKMEFTLEGYLTQLADKGINPSRPFDTNREYDVVFGEKAVSFRLPQMKMEHLTPPRIFLIRQFYHQLRPVLNELVVNEAYLRFSSFGKFSDKDIAKAYLFNTLNKQFQSSDPFEMTFYHEWLRRIGDALVDGIPPESFIEHCQQLRPYKAHLSEMVADWHPEQRSSLEDFQVSYLANKKGVHYFRSLMFQETDFNQQLHQSMRDTLLKVYKIKAQEPGHFSARFHKGAPLYPKSKEQLMAMDSTADLLSCYGEVINALPGMQKNTRNQIITLLETEQRFLQDSSHGSKTIRRGTVGSLVSKTTIDRWCKQLADKQQLKTEHAPTEDPGYIGMHRV